MKKIFSFLFALITLIINAQSPGDVAQNYGSFPGFDNFVNTIVVQNNNKIIVGGAFTKYQEAIENYIVCLNPDGSKDTSFNSGTGFNNTVNASVIQNDGKIIVGGSFSSYNGITENRIIRLNSNGSKDTGFNSGSGFSGNVNNIVIQNDGKIIVGGNFSSYNGTVKVGIIRLNSNGSVDNGFNVGTGFNSAVNTIAIQSDGKILVGGEFTNYQGVTENRIIRLNSDGSKDNSFNTGIGFNNVVNTIKLKSNGKILVGGSFFNYQGQVQNKIIQLNSDGSKDTSFSIGNGFNDGVTTIAIQNDEKILVGGEFINYQGVTENRIIRLNSDGSKDMSLLTGSGFSSPINTIIIQSNDKILSGGHFYSYNGSQKHIVRLNSDGTKDTSFNIGDGFYGDIRSIVEQNDGKIIVGGEFNSYRGVTENKIIRLNIDGSKDISFNSGTGFSSTVVTSIALQNDGKILVGGNFSMYQGIVENRIIRLNSDGSKDTSFNSGTGFDSTVNTIAIQNDGKILIGGSFSTYKGVTENRIIRLNPDGSKDTSFNSGTGFNSNVNSITIQNDGKIIVGGYFTAYQGNTENRIIRLNTDGSKDTSFNTGVGFNEAVTLIKTQSDGKIIVGGLFVSYKGFFEYRIIRLNADGSKDTSFITGSGFDNYVSSIAIQSNNKIIVGGQFSSYQGATENKIICLNTDGSKDTSFISGSGFNGYVNTILSLNNGKIIIGGGFTIYKDSNASASLIKLNSGITLNNEDFNNSDFVNIYPNPVNEILNIDILDNSTISSIKIYDLQGKLILEDKNITINVSNLSKGLYIVKVITEEREITKKFIRE